MSDLRTQNERILANHRASRNRARAAYNANRRNSDNITRQGDYQRNARAMYDAYERGDNTMARMNSDIAQNRRYTQRVYMQGQSAG